MKNDLQQEAKYCSEKIQSYEEKLKQAEVDLKNLNEYIESLKISLNFRKELLCQINIELGNIKQ